MWKKEAGEEGSDVTDQCVWLGDGDEEAGGEVVGISSFSCIGTSNYEYSKGDDWQPERATEDASPTHLAKNSPWMSLRWHASGLLNTLEANLKHIVSFHNS